MKYYPVFVRVAARPCLVVGGGTVAEQKVESLLKAAAQVTVISPDLTPRLAQLAAAGTIAHQQRRYTRGDVHGFLLAYAATDDDALHAEIAAEARAAGVLVNIVDRPPLCDFISPAIMERGDLVIATSTSGASPAMARRIRQDLERRFGVEYDQGLQLLARVRHTLAARSVAMAERHRILTALANSPLIDYLREERWEAVDRLLATIVGDGVSITSLGLELRA